MTKRQVLACRPSFPALEDILESTQADILIDLLYAYKYAYKSSGILLVYSKMYFRRSFSAILQSVSITEENLRKNIKALKEKKLIRYQRHFRDVYWFTVELSTHKYIKLAQEKLETVKDEYARQRIEKFIEILSEHDSILDVLIVPEAEMYTFSFKKKDTY